MWHANVHLLFTVRKHYGGEIKQERKIRTHVSQTVAANICFTIFHLRRVFTRCIHASCSGCIHAHMQRTGLQTWRHTGMEAYMQTCMRACAPHITFHEQLTSCLSFAAPYVWQMLRAMFHGSGAQSGSQSSPKTTLKIRCK